MKYFIAALLILLSTSPAWAQITLTEKDFFSQFDSVPVSYYSTDTTGVGALESVNGPNVTWDFTGRPYVQQQPSPGDSTLLLSDPSAAPLGNDPDFAAATNVFTMTSAAEPGVTSYEFMQIDSAGIWILGMSQDSGGIASKIFTCSPPFQEMAFPLTYQTSWQNSSVVEYDDLPATLTETLLMQDLVDGYGTLILPSDAPEALRLWSKQTVRVNYMGVVLTSTMNSFQWFTKTGFVAEIDADSAYQPTAIGYSGSANNSNAATSIPQPLAAGPLSSVGAAPVSAGDGFSIHLSQNPASNVVTTLSYVAQHSGLVRVELMDELGRSVRMLQNGFASVGEHIIPIDPATLAPGTYFIRIQAGGSSAMRKLVIQ